MPVPNSRDSEIPFQLEHVEETLSGVLNLLNAIVSLLQLLDRYRNPSAIGSAIGKPYVALSRIHAQVGVLSTALF